MTILLGNKAFRVDLVSAGSAVLFSIVTTWQLSNYLGDLKQDMRDLKASQVEQRRKDTIQDNQIQKNSRDIADNNQNIRDVKTRVQYFTEVRTGHGIIFKPYSK
jgi:L-cystine uptake protein TcyP (sodium:dicarboxylate symporter family)